MPIKIASNDLSIPLYTAIGRWRLSICDKHPTQRSLTRFDTVHLSLKPMIAAPGVFKQSSAPVRHFIVRMDIGVSNMIPQLFF